MVPSFNLAQFDTICIVCAHTPQPVIFLQSSPFPRGTLSQAILCSWGICWICPLSNTCIHLVPLPCVKSLERLATCAIKQDWPFSHQSPSVSVSLSHSPPFFCVFPFSFPEGGVAFTASNYRLYQSYISPYISVDLSSHLKGQLIALWQACVWPLKEKSRSGWSNSLPFNTYTSKHLHVLICFWSFFFHMHFISFL